jgi:hypothetical protein
MEHLAWMERDIKRIRGILVYSHGAALDARQRQETALMWDRNGGNPPIAVMTPNTLMRTLVHAFNWFAKRPIAIVAPSEFEDALRHLDLSLSEAEPLRARIAALAEAVGITPPHLG